MRSFPPRRRTPGSAGLPDNPRQSPPRFHVVLTNSAESGLMFVFHCVMELTRFGREEAFYRMWQAHFTGKARVLTTHLELAELYAEMFTERGLRATIEPA